MKRFVCPTCLNSSSEPGKGFSIERDGKHCCSICGAVLLEKHISAAMQEELKTRHSWFMFKWLFSFEALALLFLVIVVGVALSGCWTS